MKKFYVLIVSAPLRTVLNVKRFVLYLLHYRRIFIQNLVLPILTADASVLRAKIMI